MPTNFEKIPEMPNDREKLELAKTKLNEINKELEKFNLPENLPNGKDYLPSHLTDQVKKEIDILQKEKQRLEDEINYLEEKNKHNKK